MQEEGQFPQNLSIIAYTKCGGQGLIPHPMLWENATPQIRELVAGVDCPDGNITQIEIFPVDFTPTASNKDTTDVKYETNRRIGTGLKPAYGIIRFHTAIAQAA